MTYLITTTITLTVEADSEELARAVAAVTLNVPDLPPGALVMELSA